MIRVVIILSLLISINAFSQHWKKIHELRGVWKFSIGDDKKWANPAYDDSKWDDIFVPSSWEDEGYPGYDGYAWYRTDVEIKNNQDITNAYLGLGYIDDVDEVYVNGVLVGSTGTFPPFYYSAYNYERFYRLPDSVLVKNGKNIIAVRIFDRELSGGILRGNCGIFTKEYKIKIDISLEGYWKFRTGDNSNFKRTDYSDKYWSRIFVPDKWENQDHDNYDGYAWYRRKVFIPEEYIGKRLVLILGLIDDLDETYFNGVKIGSTGKFYEDDAWLNVDNEWLELRAYPVDKKFIKYGSKNLIAVRVFDGLVDGGIYEGPVGFVTYDNYIKWKTDEKEQPESFFDWFLKNLK